MKYPIYYDFEKDIYLKPSISEHLYSRIKFDNGLEIVLTQVNYEDMAGGAITFETGYLDPKYPPGYLNFAFNSMRYNDINTYEQLNQYMGNLSQSCEEFYSSTYFIILNSGFRNYLKNFKDYTSFNLNENITSYMTRRLNRLSISSFLSNTNEKEKHIIEYLVYNITDENGKDIWRQGISEDIKNQLKDNNFTEIINIAQDLFNPKKIKLIFASHYKMSLVKKFILRYLSDITQIKSEDNNEANNKIKKYEKLNTNKIIYHQISNNHKNYIKINYYIRNNNATLEQLYMDSGYFNYIKYILHETHNDSLYYQLTHPQNDEGLNIDSLSCDFEIVLKKFIRFSILIRLNEYSYKHIKEIIELTYNYIERIKEHIKRIDINDIRAEELYNITEQNFTFSEDVHTSEYYKNKAKDLFYRDERNYYLKEVWVPPEFEQKNFTKIINYINQLTKENSVVIIGMNQYTIDKYNLNSKINEESFIFENTSKTSNYSNIIYSINDLSKLKLNNNNTNSSSLIYYKNEFISKYRDNPITKGEKKSDKSYTVINDTNYLARFYLKKDISFKIPKVYINFYLFHPFIRPNNSKENEPDDYLYFHALIYLASIQRDINLILADAIRAGNAFKLRPHENYFYLNIFAYSDMVEKILEIIKEIICSKKKEIIEKNFAIYRDYALGAYANFDNADFRDKLYYEFMKYLTSNETNFPPIYNFYKFEKNKFENTTNATYLDDINAPIIYGYILGYFEMEDAEKIYNMFSTNYTEAYFKYILQSFNFSREIDAQNFVNLSLFRNQLKEIKVNNDRDEILTNRSYTFMIFSEYSYTNKIAVEMFKRIIRESGIWIENIDQKYIYLRISYDNQNYNNTKELKDDLKKKIEEKKEEYTKPLDVIGGRYYYLMKNVENEYSKNPYTMKDSAIEYSFNQLYDLPNSGSNELDKYNYDSFKNKILNILDNNEYYYEFSNRDK